MVTASPTRSRDEQKELLAALKPFEAITSPEEVPPGSYLAGLVTTAKQTTSALENLRARTSSLRERVDQTHSELDAAEALDDVERIVTLRGSLAVLVERLREVEGRASRAAQDAEAACSPERGKLI